MLKFESSKLIIPYWNHIWQSTFALLVMLNIWEILKNLYLAEHFIQNQKSGESTYCNFLNSKLCCGYVSENLKFSEQNCL